MASFDQAIGLVLAHEGGYVFNPADPGGERNFGISKRAYPNLDIKHLTEDQANEIYRQDYWRYDGIANQDVATKIFDMAVNMGPPTAHRLLQMALNAQGQAVAVDGVFGPQTLAATNRVDPTRLLQEFRAQAAVRYADIVLGNRAERTFLLGWMRRAVG
jgi:lysozyme family protein